LRPFRARNGTQEKVTVWARPGLKLKFEGAEPAGLGLKATLSENVKESTREWAVWDLRLVVPAGIQPGLLPDNTVIILRVQDTTRRVRIPVVGNAGRD
jgi:hypothetical protein